MTRPLLALFAALITIASTHAERVTVDFLGSAITVADRPFGRTVPIGTLVRGYFAYETDTPDQLAASETSGLFRHEGTSEFCAEFLDVSLTGSGRAVGTTNVFANPSFRFFDGNDHPFAGEIRVNGDVSSTAGFTMAISGTEEDMPDDSMPRRFSFASSPTTLAVRDESGTILLRVIRLAEFLPLPIEFDRVGDRFSLRFVSIKDRFFNIWFSTDLENWRLIMEEVESEGWETPVVDNLADRYSGGVIPRVGFYRISETFPDAVGVP